MGDSAFAVVPILGMLVASAAFQDIREMVARHEQLAKLNASPNQWYTRTLVRVISRTSVQIIII